MPARDAPEAANRRDGESRVKTKVDPTAENEVQLTVEVPAETVRKAYDRLVAKVRGEMVLPGFRKGRVPMNLVIQQVGADYLRAETLEDAIPEWGDEALREAGLYDDAVGTSDLKAGPLDETADYTFSIKVQTMPVPKLGEYKGLEVPQRVVEVTEAQIDAQLAMLQERLAKLEPVEDRAVQTGDFVLMDLEGSQDGELIEGAQGADQMFEIGRGNLIPGFEEALVGAQRGEEVVFDVTFPDDYQAEELAGQPATFKVNVKEIKAKIVPELDDAFAADVSEFDTLEELRTDIRTRMEAAAEAGVRREFRATAVDKAVALRHRRGAVRDDRPRGTPSLSRARGEHRRARPHHGGLPGRAREDRRAGRRRAAAAGRAHHQAPPGARADRQGRRPLGERRRDARSHQGRRRGARTRPAAAHRRSARIGQARGGARRNATGQDRRLRRRRVGGRSR